jgi:GcrA cell cycle regulator
MSWTEERILNLTTLWNEGKSASEIAQALGDVTRNAVIGKVHRLKLDGRPSPIKGPIRPREKRVAPQKAIAAFSDRACKWPIGDPRQADFHFCGGEAEPGLPYCGTHAAVAYQPARRRDDEARNASSNR